VGTFTRPHSIRYLFAVHPHTRGDIFAISSLSILNSGSPPHAWGHSHQRRLQGRTRRFTPTRVGTLRVRARHACQRPVHPHTRGDIIEMQAEAEEGDGSPPHAWGHYRYHVRYGSRERFTPTRVGTLVMYGSRGSRLQVHPHTRGDIISSPTPGTTYYGSPPHAWGHSDLDASCRLLDRFTPTRVGTLNTCRCASGRSSVHPHTRGDIFDAALQALLACGSPPHAWGH